MRLSDFILENREPILAGREAGSSPDIVPGPGTGESHAEQQRSRGDRLFSASLLLCVSHVLSDGFVRARFASWTQIVMTQHLETKMKGLPHRQPAPATFRAWGLAR
jgi:hypothetical protein